MNPKMNKTMLKDDLAKVSVQSGIGIKPSDLNEMQTILKDELAKVSVQSGIGIKPSDLNEMQTINELYLRIKTALHELT